MSDRQELVLGLDLGTSNFKAALYSRDGNCCGVGRAAVELDSAVGIESVLPPERFISMLNDCIVSAFEAAGAAIDDIKAVSYSSQTNSFLLLDENETPLTPLIIWNDRRVETPEPQLLALINHPEFLAQTGMGMPGPLMAAAKMLWFRNYQPEIWRKTERIMTISDYLCYLLTGKHTGDSSTASMLGLWSVKQKGWWQKAFELLELDSHLFSRCISPGHIAGIITAGGASVLPLPKGIPLAAGAQDHYMAALGAGVGRLADYSESTGTVLGLVSLTPKFKPSAKSVHGPGVFSDRPYYRMDFQDEGSIILNMFKRKYAPDLGFADLSRLAEEKSPGSGDVFAILKTESFSKKNNFLGQTPETSTGQYVRAIMEAITASLKLMFDKTEDVPTKVLATGGGAQSDVWLQMKADILDAEIIAVDNQESACTGAAMLAAAAAGWVESLNELPSGWVKIRKRFRPIDINRSFYFKWYEKYLAL